MLNFYELRVCDAGDDQVQLEVTGYGDTAVAPQLLDSVLCASLSHDGHHIIVDLDCCTFMDSSGLAALVEAHRRLVAEGSHLIIANAPPTITTVMELNGLDGHLDIRVAHESTA